VEARQDPRTARRRFVLWLAVVVVAFVLIVLLVWGISAHQDDDEVKTGLGARSPDRAGELLAH
jgi:hypothetical protein